MSARKNCFVAFNITTGPTPCKYGNETDRRHNVEVGRWPGTNANHDTSTVIIFPLFFFFFLLLLSWVCVCVMRPLSDEGEPFNVNHLKMCVSRRKISSSAASHDDDEKRFSSLLLSFYDDMTTTVTPLNPLVNRERERGTCTCVRTSKCMERVESAVLAIWLLYSGGAISLNLIAPAASSRYTHTQVTHIHISI